METTILKEWMIKIPDSLQSDEPMESSEGDWSGAQLTETGNPKNVGTPFNLAA